MFFHYHQNNSGGSVKGPAYAIVVEAGSNLEADAIAQANGAYFDGVGDCECCGRRWHKAWDVDGSLDENCYYSESYWVERAKEECIPRVLIVYKDGRKEFRDK